MKNISVFANFYIDDKERSVRMKDSFLSFYDANIISWIINVRGKYKNQTIKFLKKKLKNKNYSLSKIDTGNWFNDPQTF